MDLIVVPEKAEPKPVICRTTWFLVNKFESTLNIKITSILDKWNLKYDRIRGSSTTINKQLEKYRLPNGETNVLLVNSKFFGSGLNLENTTDIIHL